MLINIVYSLVNLFFCGGFMMHRYFALAALWASVACAFPALASSDYDSCMNNAQGDFDIAKCNNDEVSREMRKIQSRLSSIMTNKYFTQWNDQTLSSSQNFQTLLKQWIDYRNKYCSLYSYTFSQGIGTITDVQKSQCMLDLTNRFASNVEAIVKIYNDMAVTKR